jgi:hypothetical protein
VPQSVEVLETRLPKLQVGPNVPKRKPGQAAANAAVEGLMLRDERGKEAQIAKEEMRAWVRDLERRIQMLVSCVFQAVCRYLLTDRSARETRVFQCRCKCSDERRQRGRRPHGV